MHRRGREGTQPRHRAQSAGHENRRHEEIWRFGLQRLRIALDEGVRLVQLSRTLPMCGLSAVALSPGDCRGRRADESKDVRAGTMWIEGR